MRPIHEQLTLDLCSHALTVQSVAFVAKLIGLTQYGWAVVALPTLVTAVLLSTVIAYGLVFMRKQAKLVELVSEAQRHQAELAGGRGVKPTTARPAFAPQPIVRA